MVKQLNYLDRNEFNFEPSQKVVEAIKNFDPKELCFYTRIYDQGKKSVISVRLSEIYHVPEEQVLLGYGGEDILKNAVHYYLMKGENKTILIPQFSWWYYNKVASECRGTFEMYPLHEQADTFSYDVEEVIEYTNRIHPRMLLLASPNNPTGNSLTSEEIGQIMEHIPNDTMVLIDEAYASFITSDTDYIAPLVNKYENLIISRTLSKFYGLPGLRCGFGFIGKGHEHFVSYINKYLGYNRFSEAVALAALDSDDHYRKVADDMEWGRQLYKKELGMLPGFKVYKSVANFILIKYPVEIKDQLFQALTEKNYKIKFMTDKGLESCLRITLGRKEQTQTVCNTILEVYKNVNANGNPTIDLHS
jgi:histidinol-phosphate aminotransferase